MMGVPAYFGKNDIRLISLCKDVAVVTAESITDNEEKLSKYLEKQKAYDANTVAICDFGIGRINLLSDHTYNGIVWSTRGRISGKWMQM